MATNSVRKKNFIKAFQESESKTIVGIAKHMNVNEKALRQYLRRNKDLRQEYYDYRDAVVMETAGEVVATDIIENMSVKTAQWWLARRNSLYNQMPQKVEIGGELDIKIVIEDIKNNIEDDE